MSESDFLAKRPLLRLFVRAVRNWRERHQTPFSFWIHMLGIPVAVGGFFWFLGAIFMQDWTYWPGMLGAFLGGYALQYAGHLVEGNTMGELIPLYRALGWRYRAVAPQFQHDEPNTAP